MYDLLLRYNLHIVGEKSIPVNHCLMVNKGVAIGDLKRVMSHPQALAQVCDDGPPALTSLLLDPR